MGLWRETALATSSVDRDLIRAGQRDDEIIRLWKAQFDTAAIAKKLNVRECEVANRLWRIR
jgi:hypothetical protein